MTKSTVLVFTRAPIAGQTKTRLIPLLGAKGAAEFHQNVLLDMLAIASGSDFATVEIWCDTEIKDPYLQQCMQNYSYSTHIQQGNDLGERMNHATHAALGTNSFVVLIGSDCPTLTTGIINQSYQQLSNGKDAVLGPSKDGGYYLIGLKKPDPEIFQGIIWGKCDVAEKTRQNFIRLGLDHVELEELSDIDTAEDYQEYIDNSCLLA